MSETSFIDAFLRPFDLRGAGVLVGPGSDCAAVRPSRGQQLVATTDAVVEGVHFDRRWFAAEDVGHKALAVNLSDLAAAGARPRWFLCALGVPREAGAQAYAARMARGMATLARAHGCAIIGGNVSAAAQWSVTITALGEARRPLTRAGGRPGDALVLLGALGDAAAALRLLRAPFTPRPAPSGSDPLRVRDEVSRHLRHSAPAAGSDPLRVRDEASSPVRQPRRGGAGSRLHAQLRPTPLVEAGLAAAPIASAAIDLSDGLLRDLGHLCAQSACGATIECAALPIGRLAAREADALALALSGGEDYALLLAVRPRKLGALLRAAPRAVEIGRLLPASAGVSLTEHGVARPLPASPGFDHLA
jgi:thiamine-monophosphate kinase